MYEGLTMLHCSAKRVTRRVKITFIVTLCNFWCLPRSTPSHKLVEWFPVHTSAGKLVTESHGDHLQDVLHESGVRVKVGKLKTSLTF